VALVLADQGQRLYVANQRTGSVSVIDTARKKVIDEFLVGRKLSSLAATPDSNQFLALDEEAGELLLFHRHAGAVEVTHRLKVGPSPVDVQIAADGTRCCVASLWSRQVTIVQLGSTEPKVNATVVLPFAPRKQLLVPKTDHLIVADAFGGRLGVVDVRQGVVESVRTLPAHNIRGLALSSDGTRLLVAHQTLHNLATASFDDIHWGNLLTNHVRALALADLLTPGADLLRNNVLYHLGDTNRGAGDPAGVAVRPAGAMVVALAGVGEIAIGKAKGGTWERLAVGTRPTELVVSSDGQLAYVANTLADSVSVVDLHSRKVVATITLGLRSEPDPVERGERLFYDARLSHDAWLSCHSCHPDGHSNGQLVDNLSDGSFGTPKRVLSLLGVRDTGPFAWNGGMRDLETQVRTSIQSTMQGTKPTAEQVQELAAYLRTLAPPPPRLRDPGPAQQVSVGRGREVFERQQCGNCHTPPTYTSAKTYNVGLADEAGNTHFNPPSLRGVSQGGPYFHDGRAATLEEVFTRYRHQLKDALTGRDLKDLLTFLSSV
jgi:YVTN family beta-propeller protein